MSTVKQRSHIAAAAYAPYDGKEARRIVEPLQAGTRVLPQVPKLIADDAAANHSLPELLLEYVFRFAAFLGDFTLTALTLALRRYAGGFSCCRSWHSTRRYRS